MLTFSSIVFVVLVSDNFDVTFISDVFFVARFHS